MIVVDNNSSDKTIVKAREFGHEIFVTIDTYQAGKALNLGIQKARVEYIVCLSAH